MPFPVSHVLVGASVVAAIHPQPAKRYSLPLLIGGFLSIIPDFDFLLVLIFGSYELHRGFTHSLLLALIVTAAFVLSFGKRRLKEALAYGLAFASHSVLDYMTTKDGDAVALLSPFSDERFSFGRWGFSESPEWYMPMEIISSFAQEFIIFAPPLLLILILRKLMQRNFIESSPN
jgi:inner membrane protein